ncbi:NAD(P)/FAD-dependent oxidoreductase [Silicimonas sp. MF1-12-2]|uniref:NAD(P)/FAD-dependent oxidoreductase n=1 Tax=Silicimonas sp. MF1-12-2 TaxID=3384793 RepID=UPI0039B45D29
MRVAVIGGGIAGLSAAARLAPDAKVTVFEAEAHLGYHTSGRSAAMYEENYGNAAVRALNRASKDWFETSGVLSPRGIMLVALEAEIPLFETDLTDMGMEELSLAEARARVPILSPSILRAAIHEGASDIDTGRVLDLFARSVTEAGGRIVKSAEVVGLSRREGGWQVETREGLAGFDVVVNAAGAWADRVAALAGVQQLGLKPYRRSMARLPAPGGHDVRDWPMLFGPGESWYAKPDAGGWIVSPAEEDPSEPMDAWADDMVLAEGLARYEAHVTEPVTRVQSNWAGLRTFAPDRTLVIGADPVAEGFFWMAGQGGYGFQTAPAASRLLADTVLGLNPKLPDSVLEALSPARFGQAKSGV